MDRKVATASDGVNTEGTPSHVKLDNIKQDGYTDDELASTSIKVDDGLHEFPVYNTMPEEHITASQISVIGFSRISSDAQDTSQRSVNDGPHSNSTTLRLEHTFNAVLHPGESKTYEPAVTGGESEDERYDSSQEDDDDEMSSADMDSVPEEDDSTPEENNSTPDEDDSDYDPYYDPHDEPIVQYLYFSPLHDNEESTTEDGQNVDQDEDDADGDHDEHQDDEQDDDQHDDGKDNQGDQHDDQNNHQDDQHEPSFDDNKGNYQGGHRHDHPHRGPDQEDQSSERIHVVEQEQHKLHESRLYEEQHDAQHDKYQNRDLLQIVDILGEMADIHDEAVVRKGKGELAHRMTLEAICEEADKIHEEFCRKLKEKELRMQRECESLQEYPGFLEWLGPQELMKRHRIQKEPQDPQLQLQRMQLQKMYQQDHQDHKKNQHLPQL